MDNEDFNIKRYLGKLILEFNKQKNKITELERTILEQEAIIGKLQNQLNNTVTTNFENIKNMSIDEFVDYIYSVFLAGRMSATAVVEYEDYKDFLMKEYHNIGNK